MLNEIRLGDCLDVMTQIPSGSVDMILCDLPYGTTACSWDTVVPFEPLWAEYKRIIKPNGAIALTAAQPFTSALVMSNPQQFRYEWIWEKTIAANFQQMKRRPAKKHENILVFYDEQPVYNPQMEPGEPYTDKARGRKVGIYRENINESAVNKVPIINDGTRYPSSVQRFPNPNNKTVHPTQKPVALFEYLIKTYTNPGETVLDNCIGSGTTAIAALNTGRNFIGIERDPQYHLLAVERVENHRATLFPSWLLPVK